MVSYLPPFIILAGLWVKFCCLANILIDLSNVTLADFRQTINHYDVIFVSFHFTDKLWRIMKGDLVEVAENLKDISPNIPIAKVDCSSATGFKICSEINVVDDPTLTLLRYGSIDKIFHQSRDSKTITNWLKRNSRLKSIRLWSYEKLNQLLDDIDDIIVIAIFSSFHDDLVESYHQATLEVARKSHPGGVSFFHIFEDASGKTSDLTNIGLKPGKLLKTPTIILRRPKWLSTPLEDSSVVYEIKSGEDIVGWISRKAYGTVAWVTKENQDDLKAPFIVAYFDFDFIRRADFSRRWRNDVIRMSRKFPQINFAVANSLDFRNTLKKLGIKAPKKNDEPIFMATDLFGSNFVMRDEFSEKNLATFIRHYSEGQLAPISASQNIQTGKMEANPALSREIVGNSFHKHVSYSPKDILIRFHEPSCRYSQEFEPYWRELVNQLVNEPNLELISMDGRANTIPSQFKITQLPTIYMIPSTTKEKIKYNGSKTLHELIQFVAKWSSEELVNFRRDGSRQIGQLENSSRRSKSEL